MFTPGDSRVSGPEILLQLIGTDSPPHSCILLGIEHGEIHIRADEWIEPGSHVNATFARISVAGEVLHCTRKDGWCRISVAVNSTHDLGRRQPRLPVYLPGSVVAFSGNGSDSGRGTLLDVSISGMRLDTSHRVEVGAMIFVETRSVLVVGEVRYCNKREKGGYDAGVEVTDVLSDIKSAQNSQGVLKKIRRKLAEAILGEPIAIAREATSGTEGQ
jgi:hypothetical protein